MRVRGMLCLLFISSSALLGQNDATLGVGEIKQWKFQVQSHPITIKLSSFPGGIRDRGVLSLKPDKDSKPSASETAVVLRQVFSEMTALKFDPARLEMITTWLRNSEYVEGVERAVSESGEWKSCSGLKYCHQAEPAADRYLAMVDAFKEYDAVLHEYGLRRKATRIDDMGVHVEDGHVVCEGMIVITIEKDK